MNLTKIKIARIATKGVALICAIENGLVKKRFLRGYDITSFMKFWDDFSEAMEESEGKIPNGGDSFDEKCNNCSGDKKGQASAPICKNILEQEYRFDVYPPKFI